MDTEIEDRLEALDDTLAGHDDSIIALKKQVGALAQQVAKLMAFAAQAATRIGGVPSPIDEQATLIAARANERARQVTPGEIRVGRAVRWPIRSHRRQAQRGTRQVIAA